MLGAVCGGRGRSLQAARENKAMIIRQVSGSILHDIIFDNVMLPVYLRFRHNLLIFRDIDCVICLVLYCQQ